MKELKELIETELEKFNEENSYADTFELALYFFNKGREYQEENLCNCR